MTDIVSNYNDILSKISRCKKEFPNSTQEVKLIAVSKTFPIETIEKIILQGQNIFGENKVQEACQKWPLLKSRYKNIELHLIGLLQTNKVKIALDVFDVIQTLDREKLVTKISNYLNPESNKTHSFFVQVNTGDEPQKSGIHIARTEEFVEWCSKEKKLNIEGLMCIPPVNESSNDHFEILKKLAKKCNLNKLSMGMSSDFIEAIICGATHVRVGSGIFGQRG
tara:strand:+ start:3662 stop:4330 length:669 start_codon:yes stop_codon:yes gene_type:complete